MKKSIILLFAIASVVVSNAQIASLGINYQAQVRNNAGVLIPDSLFTMRFQLLPSQFSTQPVWMEEHNVTTDRYGIAGVVIGKGMKTGGTFASFDLVDFAVGNMWIKVEVKNGGGTFVPLGSSEPFQAVPYAKVAGNAVPFPPGFIMPFAGNRSKMPQGWLLCDGSPVSRSVYATLYAVIADNWGRGDNSTTFNLPDLRGQFLRGVDKNISGNVAPVDPDRVARTAKYPGGNIGNDVGSYQPGALAPHQHMFGGNSLGSTPSPFDEFGLAPTSAGNYNGKSNNGSVFNMEFSYTSSTGPSIGNETRPTNAYVYFLIKY